METMFTRIKKRRMELGMTQDELAVKAGYSDKSAISHLEKGETDPPQSKIIALADALQTTPSYLLDGYDIESIYNQIKIMDDFDRMILINRLNKDVEKRRSLHDILMEEHSTNINVEEARKIIDDVINKEPKKLIKVGMPQITKQPKPKKA